MPDRLIGETDEIGRADDFQDREGGDRGGEQRREADGHQHGVDDEPGRGAEKGSDAGTP
jgi:hypothetical protein